MDNGQKTVLGCFAAAACGITTCGVLIYGGIGYGIFKAGEYAYDNSTTGMQRNALSAVFEQNMTGETAVNYLGANGYTPAEAAKFTECNEINAANDSLSQMQLITNVRNCMTN